MRVLRRGAAENTAVLVVVFIVESITVALPKYTAHGKLMTHLHTYEPTLVAPSS